MIRTYVRCTLSDLLKSRKGWGPRCANSRAPGPTAKGSNVSNASESSVHEHEDECQRWDGPREAYQDRVRVVAGVGIHHWISTSCGEPWCITENHLVAKAPQALDYLDGVCVYCGQLAETVDHLLPRHWTGDGLRRRVLTLPACRQCNSTLGDRYIPSITERRETVHAALYRRYKTRLREAEDLDRLMSEIGPNLRSAIDQQRAFARTVRSRLAWPETDHYDIGACTRAGFEDPYAAGLITDVTPVDYKVELVKAQRKFFRDHRGFWPKPDPSVPCPRSCRCANCIKLTPQDRRRRERVLIDGVLVHPDPSGGHGTPSGYQGYGCRCQPCIDAFMAKKAEVDEKRRLRQLQSVWIPDPRRPWQGLLNLWANGKPRPDGQTAGVSR